MKTLIQLSASLRRQRKNLALNQKDMLMKIGMSQQQYQRVEAGGDLRVSTLMRILEGMELELMLAPSDRVGQMERALKASEQRNESRVADEYAGRVSDQGSWDLVIADLEDEES